MSKNVQVSAQPGERMRAQATPGGAENRARRGAQAQWRGRSSAQARVRGRRGAQAREGTWYLEEGLGGAPALLVVLYVGEEVPAVPVLGAERDVVGVPDGRVHDHVVHGDGRLAGEGVLLPQLHLAVAL